MNAQIAACRTGEARFRAILDRFGLETVEAARHEIYRQSEVLEREAVAAIPDGVYEAEGFLDDDGLGHGPLPVCVIVDVTGDRMTIDLAGSAPQTEGPINGGLAQAISAVRVAFKLLVHPERPVDGGTFRTLDVAVPPRTIFSAEEPAACQWYFTPCGLLIDLIVKALAPALPAAAAAAHYGDSMVVYLEGTDPRRDDARFLMNAPHPGGWGGFDGGDGADGLINNVNGAFKDYPVEVAETKWPIVVRRYGLLPDTGGPGRFRGGCGVLREFELAGPTRLSLWFERSVTPAWGLFGGSPGAKPDVVVNEGRGDERHLLKVNALPLAPGSTFRLETGGGGGFGDPCERDPALVAADVADGYVSLEAAARDYGVILDVKETSR